MEMIQVFLPILIAVWMSATNTESCSVSSEYYRTFTPEGLLVNAPFVVRGYVDQIFDEFQRDGTNNTKATFRVQCVHKTTPDHREVCDTIIINHVNIYERTSCSYTRVELYQEVYLALSESSCLESPNNCTYDIYESNVLQSAAINVTAHMTDSVQKTCGLQNFHPPRNCTQSKYDISCPLYSYSGPCVTASSQRFIYNGIFMFALFLLKVIIIE